MLSPVRFQELSSEAVPIAQSPAATEIDAGLWVGIGAVGAAIAVLGYLLFSRSPAAAGGPNFAGATLTEGPTVFQALRDALFRRLERVTRSSGRNDAVKRLDRAGLRIQVGELIMMNVVTVLVFGGIGYMWRGLLGALVGSILAVVLPRFYVDNRSRRRRKAFDEALPDVLSSVANVLRVGYSLNVGLGTVAKEYEDPISSELNRALIESRVSGDIGHSLRAVADRMDSNDLRWVIDAIEINSTVGGDLVEVLESVASTIRSRARLNAQVSALTAEARMSAIVLFLLPPGLALFIAFSNPEYFDGIWGTSLTYWMIGLVVVMLTSGGLWIRRMINAAVL